MTILMVITPSKKQINPLTLYLGLCRHAKQNLYYDHQCCCCFFHLRQSLNERRKLHRLFRNFATLYSMPTIKKFLNLIMAAYEGLLGEEVGEACSESSQEVRQRVLPSYFRLSRSGNISTVMMTL